MLSDPVVRITSIFPNRDTGPFGPESGGTNITLTGSHLDLTGKNTGAYLQSSFYTLRIVFVVTELSGIVLNKIKILIIFIVN